MSTKITFAVSPCGASLVLEHDALPPDTWNDAALSPKLVISSGVVDSSDSSKLVCQSVPDNVPVVTLVGASWNSQVGDTGNGTCDLCKNTPDPQSWSVTART